MCENLAYGINKKKYNVVLVSLYNYKSAITERLEENGYKIIYLNKKRGFDFSMYNKLKKVFNEERPDVIHTHLYVLEYVALALKLSKLKNVKIVHTIHNIANRDGKKFIQILQKILFKKKNIIPVAISEEIKKSVIEFYNLDERRIKMVYNGIDLSRCIVKKDYSQFNSIIHIGRLEKVKNHKELIDVFKKFIELTNNQNTILYLIGEGVLFQDIKEYIEKVNLEKRVILCGKRAECYKELNNADLFVLPSKYEGMPMTIIEAMGTGLPIIASNVGGIPNMIQDGKNGLIINEKNDFLEKLIRVSEDEILREHLGKEALKVSEKFSNIEMAYKYEKIYFEGDNNESF